MLKINIDFHSANRLFKPNKSGKLTPWREKNAPPPENNPHIPYQGGILLRLLGADLPIAKCFSDEAPLSDDAADLFSGDIIARGFESSFSSGVSISRGVSWEPFRTYSPYFSLPESGRDYSQDILTEKGKLLKHYIPHALSCLSLEELESYVHALRPLLDDGSDRDNSINEIIEDLAVLLHSRIPRHINEAPDASQTSNYDFLVSALMYCHEQFQERLENLFPDQNPPYEGYEPEDVQLVYEGIKSGIEWFKAFADCSDLYSMAIKKVYGLGISSNPVKVSLRSKIQPFIDKATDLQSSIDSLEISSFKESLGKYHKKLISKEKTKNDKQYILDTLSIGKVLYSPKSSQQFRDIITSSFIHASKRTSSFRNPLDAPVPHDDGQACICIESGRETPQERIDHEMAIKDQIEKVGVQCFRYGKKGVGYVSSIHLASNHRPNSDQTFSARFGVRKNGDHKTLFYDSL